ncbi:grifin isoform X2 [Narcine bancroftii]|uniref:grifin isoform X2 n=1 Tax=Narcine bancroftii TaxID=1343680 RepID=UPI00383177C6
MQHEQTESQELTQIDSHESQPPDQQHRDPGYNDKTQSMFFSKRQAGIDANRESPVHDSNRANLMALRFEAELPDGLCPGWNVTVKGEPTSGAKRFEVNFLCDRSEEIAFHFNPRFTESLLVCNSYLANKWGTEERSTAWPCEVEEPFQVEIYSDEEYFHVLLDGAAVCQFKHRVKNLNSITRFQVLNDVKISSVEITKNIFM